jgi:hypothetical protein
MVDNAVAMKAVTARVGHKALHSPGLLLGGPTEQVASGEPGPTLREIVTEKQPSVPMG